MVQVLDYFRRLYKQETGKEISTEPGPENQRVITKNPDGSTIYSGPIMRQPTWEYLLWLEARLRKYEKEPLPEVVITTATSGENK